MCSERRIDSKKALIEAASELFTAKGYEAVSTRELTDAAGVNLAAIQYHFGSKENLFVATMRQLMDGSSCARSHELLQSDLSSARAAAVQLGTFITAMLANFLRAEGPQPCRLMFREIFSGASQNETLFRTLVTTVVNDYIRPTDEPLLKLLAVLCPKAGTEELELSVHSIVGQCAFYITHGPFVELLRGRRYADSPHFERAAAHIVRFTLRAVNFDDREIEGVIADALERYQTLAEQKSGKRSGEKPEKGRTLKGAK